ncbi:kynureninase [bacterium]|nr:kynureninase [bacterium]
MTQQDFKNRALELDRDDPLGEYAARFYIPDKEVIYLDGNSLGRLPLRSMEILENLTKQQWGERLIRSWNEHWIELPKRIARKIARLTGAGEDEVFIGDATSVNLYKLAFGALAAQRSRSALVTDDLNFPSDLYVFQGLIRNHFPDRKIVQVMSRDGMIIPSADIKRVLSNDTALLSLSHVAYKSGFMYDMHQVNTFAHDAGALVLWDLSHAVGAVPIDLNGSGADLAVGCTYKYLNGGPGAPAFLYVRKDLQERIMNPIWGWFGHARPFDFAETYTPALSAGKYAVGTPGILSLAAVEPGADLLLKAGMGAVREKSLQQSRFLLSLYHALLSGLGFTLGSPEAEEQRGSHITLRHPDGYRISRAMIEPRDGSGAVIPDFRPPDNIRLGIAPLYTGFMDIFRAVERMRTIVEQKIYQDYPDRTNEVP